MCYISYIFLLSVTLWCILLNSILNFSVVQLNNFNFISFGETFSYLGNLSFNQNQKYYIILGAKVLLSNLNP